MNILSILTIFISILFSSISLASVKEKMELNYYSPFKVDMNTFQCKLKIEGVTEYLNEIKSLGDIKNVYYSLKWEKGKKISIKVEGLPEGFAEIKSQLIQQVSPYIYVLYPNKFIQSLKEQKGVKFNLNSREVVSKITSKNREINFTYKNYDSNRKLMWNKIEDKYGAVRVQIDIENGKYQKWFFPEKVDINSYLTDSSGKSKTISKRTLMFYDFKVNENL